jgi:hypothetical protein
MLVAELSSWRRGLPRKVLPRSPLASHLAKLKCIQKLVMKKRATNGRQHLGIGMGMVILTSWFLALAITLPAAATPIHPTAEQLLRQAEQPAMPYIPAQVGWQEPSADRENAGENGIVAGRFNAGEILRDAEDARFRRTLLVQIGRPDPRVLLAFAAIILLLRKMRTLRQGAPIPRPAQAISH